MDEVRSAGPLPNLGQPPVAVEGLPSLITPAANPAAPGGVVGQVVLAAVEQVARAVQPQAAVAVAAEFTFPLALALAVVVFLIIQGQVDRRDPKLRLAPQHAVETFVKFVAEEEL